MDVIWGYLSSLKLGNGSHKFGTISDVAKTVFMQAKKEFFLLLEKTKQLFGLLFRVTVH